MSNDKQQPYQIMVVSNAIKATADPCMRGMLMSDPAGIFAASGYPLQERFFSDFNEFARPRLAPILEHIDAGNSLEDYNGLACTFCEIGAWGVATLLVSVGAGGLVFLTAQSAPVLALAAFAGVSAESALAFIAGLSTAIASGVAEVSARICAWVGACS